jgi:hypothetical protein
MDNPREDTADQHYVTHGTFTIAAVRADPETNGMEADFATAHVDLKVKSREFDDLEETLHEQEAVIVVRDRSADKIVRSFELRLLATVEKNRDDPRYRRYFSNGLRAVTEADARTVEPKLIRDIIKTLDEDQSKPGLDVLYSEFRNKFLAAVEAVEAADAACTQTEGQLAFLEDKIIVELKQKWIESRTKLHAQLTLKFPLDAQRVESYFRRFAKPRKKP